MFALVIGILAAGVGDTSGVQPATVPSPPTAVRPAVVVAARPPANADDQIICRRETPVGSRVPGPKTCATRAEWRTYTQDSKDMISDIQNRALRISGPPQ